MPKSDVAHSLALQTLAFSGPKDAETVCAMFLTARDAYVNAPEPISLRVVAQIFHRRESDSAPEFTTYLARLREASQREGWESARLAALSARSRAVVAQAEQEEASRIAAAAVDWRRRRLTAMLERWDMLSSIIDQILATGEAGGGYSKMADAALSSISRLEKDLEELLPQTSTRAAASKILSDKATTNVELIERVATKFEMIAAMPSMGHVAMLIQDLRTRAHDAVIVMDDEVVTGETVVVGGFDGGTAGSDGDAAGSDGTADAMLDGLGRAADVLAGSDDGG